MACARGRDSELALRRVERRDTDGLAVDPHRGAQPLARLLGAGISSDAFHMVAPAPDGLRAGHAMKRAMETAGLSPKDINHVNAHATSTPLNDAAETRASRLTLKGHQGQAKRPSALIWDVIFSPDGSLLASAGGDSTIRLWDVASGTSLLEFTGHSAYVNSVAFSPDGGQAQRIEQGRQGHG